MMKLRGVVYRLGGRPRRGSIWYSPSLEMIYAFKDADFIGTFKRELNRSNYQEDK